MLNRIFLIVSQHESLNHCRIMEIRNASIGYHSKFDHGDAIKVSETSMDFCFFFAGLKTFLFIAEN